jgi:glycosyltransferase involved in cell wall biosynthesis
MTQEVSGRTQCITTKKPVADKLELDAGDAGCFSENFVYSDSGGQSNDGGLRRQGLSKGSTPERPLVTIITVVLNGARHLEGAIQSVLRQSYKNIEYIIVDGGSTDGSIEIIKKYESVIDYWISENDSGIYHAMNKGIALAGGELIGIINADDWYELRAVEYVVREYQASKDAVLHGEMNCIDVVGFTFKRSAKVLSRPNLIYMEENHPTVFVPMRVYEEVGLFDLRFKTIADWELLTRCHEKGIPFVTIGEVLANFREGGVSSRLTMARSLEKFRFRRDHGYRWAIIHYVLELGRLFGSSILRSIGLHEIYRASRRKSKSKRMAEPRVD